jgi:sensor c-di-GMP phosphodiesterase-like protein
MRITEDGYSAWLTTQNDLGFNRYMAVLGQGHYLVMIDPASLVDVIPFGEIAIDAALVGIQHTASLPAAIRSIRISVT